MSHQAEDRMFWFRGNAVAFGGRIESPVCESLDAQGASVLPPTGGFASASVGSFNYKNVVSFERASSTVAGRVTEHKRGKTYDTQVTVAVEGLNVLDMVTADRVVARLTSTHPEEKNDPEMLPIGSYFENLRIAGVPIEMQLSPELIRCRHYAELSKLGEASKEHAGRYVDARGEGMSYEDAPDPSLPAWSSGMSSPIFEDRLYLACLFDPVDESKYPPAGTEKCGETGIHVPDFGIIYLGEYLISRFSRRLTMLRIELGCPVKGTIVCGYGDGNGHVFP